MDIREAIAYINEPKRNGSRFGLASIARLLEKLGNPHKTLKYIHVAGTNGKGSTSVMMASVLRCCGYAVGLFTSPYLRRFNDRIQFNGQDIPDEEIVAITESMKKASEAIEREGDLPPTTFELVTAMAFVYFAEQKADIVVLEVGLGGTLDCTNIIDAPLAAVMTPISYDHMAVLGHDLTSIALNKAGIIKPGTVCISGRQEKAAMDVLENRCHLMDVSLIKTDFSRRRELNATDKGSLFTWEQEGKEFIYELPLVGHYQLDNAALALTALEELAKRGAVKLTAEGVKEGFLCVTWPGRLEVMREKPYVVLDGSHNPQGVANLVRNMDIFSYERCFLVMGVMADKDVGPMIETLVSHVTEVFATSVPMPRAMKPDVLGEKWEAAGAEVTVVKDPLEAVAMAFQKAAKRDLILVAGSLYLVSTVRGRLASIVD